MNQLYSLLVLLSVTAVATAEIKVETVMVSMRDGVTLATDIYRDDSTAVAPVVLMRTYSTSDTNWGEGRVRTIALCPMAATLQ